MATAKSKKAATKQTKTAKSPVKKAANAAKGAKKAVKKSSAKKVQTSKSHAGKPAKSAAPKKMSKSPVSKSGGAKTKTAAGKKAVAKKPVKVTPKVSAKAAPAAKKSTKPQVGTKATAAQPAKVKPATVPASKQTAEKQKEQQKVKAIKPTTVPPVKQAEKPGKKAEKAPKVVAEKPSKSKKEQDADGEEGPDPVQIKTDKLIKELEESMDLSKMKPRIQAGTTPKPLVKQAHPPLKLVEPTNTNKVKYQLEFEFRSSPKILFTSLSDSSGLAGWFADEVKTKDDLYTFIWEGGESYAKLVAIRDLQLVRFQWLDDTDGTYFQFEIKEDDITSDIALLITDFALPGEKDTNIKLWEAQVQKLRMVLGSL
jgi:uncharacterized protein YndB with AHSA1/START domain